MKRQDGFTLLELMISISIISILTAVAIPNLLNARKSANQVSAIASLRTLAAVNEQFRVRFQTYAGKLSDLAARGYIDRVLGFGRKSGYRFFLEGDADTWRCNADPLRPGITGDLHFFIDQTGTIFFSRYGSAGPRDLPLD